MKVKRLTFAILFLIFTVGQVFGQELKDTSILVYQTMLHFDTDKYKINKTHIPLLSEFISKFPNNKKYHIVIKAHTDDVASNKYNLKLSEKREKAILNYLLQNGIPKEYINSNHFGESKPLVTGHKKASRKMNRRGLIQLFKKQKLKTLSGEVVDDDNKPVNNAKIDLNSKSFKFNTTSDQNGQFKLLAPIDEEVSITTIAPKHFFKTIKIKKPYDFNISKLKIKIIKLEIGKKFISRNLLFLGNHSNLLVNSFDELNALIKTLKINPNTCIEIAGHINRPGKTVKRYSWEHELSIARAQTIYDTLVNSGIKPERMVVKGYANWNMLYPHPDNEAQMSLNRRVEIHIKDCIFAAKTKNEIIKSNRVFYLKKYKLKFNIATMPEFIHLFTLVEKDKILKNLKYLKANNIDVNQYNYKELIEGNFEQ